MYVQSYETFAASNAMPWEAWPDLCSPALTAGAEGLWCAFQCARSFVTLTYAEGRQQQQTYYYGDRDHRAKIIDTAEP